MTKGDADLNDSGFGIFGAIIGIGFVSLLVKARKARVRESARKNTPCKFNDGVSQAEFNEIVKNAGKRIKRLTSLMSVGPIVYGTVESQSGLSEWSFKIDFNDYGHITGEYWLMTDNDDSKIPERVAGRIRDAILNPEIMNLNSSHDQDEYGEDDDTEETLKNHDAISKEAKTYVVSKKKRHLLLGLIMMTVAIFVLGWYEYNNLIPVGYSKQSLVGVEYEKVVNKLKNAGFSAISAKEIPDLLANQISDEYEVADVQIGWITSFSDTTKLPSNFPVTVTYHTVKKITVPISAKEAKGSNYKDVQKAFKDAGFTNVSTEVEYDIITGWLADDGEVESVIVDGDKKYDFDDEYKLNSDVVITYHTFRKNKSD